VVDVRNDGTLAGLADDDVVEVPARIGKEGAVALAQERLAPQLLGLVQHVAAYERLAAAAARSGDRDLARLALMTNPLVREWGPADSMLERLLAAETPAPTTTRVGVGP
jgi:6-phospho-beta-glucosidase